MNAYRDLFGRWRVKAIKNTDGSLIQIDWPEINTIGPVFEVKNLKPTEQGYQNQGIYCPHCRKKVAGMNYGNWQGRTHAGLYAQLACEAHLIENPTCLQSLSTSKSIHKGGQS